MLTRSQRVANVKDRVKSEPFEPLLPVISVEVYCRSEYRLLLIQRRLSIITSRIGLDY